MPDTKCSFAPVVNPKTRLLLLGSLPGEKSLQQQQYYAHPQNRFWHLLSEVVQQDLVALDYAGRLAAVQNHAVGLWDVVAQARREGSLDSNIRERSDNDLSGLLDTLPKLSAIGFNGATAARIGLQLLGPRAAAYQIFQLPSSSPAYTLAYTEKRSTWLKLQSALIGDAMQQTIREDEYGIR